MLDRYSDSSHLLGSATGEAEMIAEKRQELPVAQQSPTNDVGVPVPVELPTIETRNDRYFLVSSHWQSPYNPSITTSRGDLVKIIWMTNDGKVS